MKEKNPWKGNFSHVCMHIHMGTDTWIHAHSSLLSNSIPADILKHQASLHAKEHLPTRTSRSTGKLTLSVWKCQAPWC